MPSNHTDYRLLDSGDSRKLEQFGPFRLIRPCASAIWGISDSTLWAKADSEFKRQGKETGTWSNRNPLPDVWEIKQNGLRYTIEPNNYGNVGLFPEHWSYQEWLLEQLNYKPVAETRILNLFSYSGSNSLALIEKGCFVTNVDSSRQSMELLSKNMELNGLTSKSRLILDDVQKFLKREINRGQMYDGILLDPPTFGRGAHGEVFKIEENLIQVLDLCRQVLTPKSGFVMLTCHTPSFTPNILKNLMKSVFRGDIEAAEIELKDDFGRNLNAGAYARLSRVKQIH